MGQRLVIHIYYGENGEREELANLYAHWGGYTVSALTDSISVMKQIIAANLDARIFDGMPKKKRQELLAGIFENALLGSGISQGSWRYLYGVDMPKDKEGRLDRNSGLIGLSPKDISESDNWSEGDANIILKEGSNGILVPLLDFEVCFVEPLQSAIDGSGETEEGYKYSLERPQGDDERAVNALVNNAVDLQAAAKALEYLSNVNGYRVLLKDGFVFEMIS